MDAVAEAKREKGKSFSPRLVLSYLPRPWASGRTMALHESLRVRDTAASPGFIAGVTNPIFESSGCWDLLCDVAAGRMVVSKDIHSSHPPVGNHAGMSSTLARNGTLRAESSIGSEDDLGRLPGRENQASKSDFTGFTAKADNADNVSIEDVSTQHETKWEQIRTDSRPFLVLIFLDHHSD